MTWVTVSIPSIELPLNRPAWGVYTSVRFWSDCSSVAWIWDSIRLLNEVNQSIIIGGCHRTIYNQKPAEYNEDIHFLLNELQPSIDSHHGLILLLLQQDRADELVDMRLLIQTGKFAMDALVLLLL